MAAVLTLVALQGTAPLRKSDLVRLLSGSAMSPAEIAQLVHQNCLTFRPLLGMRAAAADSRVFRVLEVGQDSISGRMVLKPDQPGTTSLALMGNGLRQYLTVTVPPRSAPGAVDCPSPPR